MTPPLPPKTAVVTVTYNSSETLPDFVRSIANEEGVSGIAIVVVDNSSRDVADIRTICESAGATLIESPKNLGYGGGANLAIAQLRHEVDLVLISNPDVLFESGAIGALAEVLDSDPRIGAVGPRVMNSDGSVYPSARSLPSLRTGIGHAVFATVWPSNPWSARYHSDGAVHAEAREAGWLSGSCIMVRRSAFESIGGFDESFFMYFEDVDLGYRLRDRGWLNVYYPLVSVTHTGAHSTKTQPERMIKAHHLSAAQYLDRRYSGFLLAPLRVILRCGLWLRAAIEVARVRRSR